MREFNIPLKIQGYSQLIGSIAPQLQSTLDAVAETIAIAAYNTGSDIVQQKLHSTRLDYQNHFHYKKIDKSNHEIWLDPEANHLEDGYGSFDLKPGLLKNVSNNPGKKGQGISKDGTRWKVIPFRHKTEKAASNLVEQYLGQQADEVLRTGISRLNRMPTDLTKIQSDSSGAPLQGNVGRIANNPLIHPTLQGLTKYQKTYKEVTQSQYMTFRVVSDKSKAGSWIHPGFDGVHAFRDMEHFIDKELDRIIRSF